MPQPRWSVRYVRTINELPPKLTLGRAYFVADKQCIIVDYGSGPVIIGERVGAQGRPGEPIPELQSQIDSLAQASIQNSASILEFSDVNKDLTHLQKLRVQDILTISAQIQKLSEGMIILANSHNQLCEILQNTQSIFLKALLELDAQNSFAPIQSNDTITSADGYTWKVLESTGNSTEGTITFSLVQ